MKLKVILIRLIKETPGHHHGWYESNVGILRKPLGQDIYISPSKNIPKPNLFKKLINLIIKLYEKFVSYMS